MDLRIGIADSPQVVEIELDDDVDRTEVKSKVEASLTPCETNPIDVIWADQPAPPMAPIVPHDLVYTGQNSTDKRKTLCKAMANDGLDAVIVTSPDSTAWMLNIRGGDVPYTPIPLLFSLLHQNHRVDLFIDAEKITPGLSDHLGDNVSLLPTESLGDALDKLKGKKVRVVRNGTAIWILERLKKTGASLSFGDDPCALPKARKNATELAGMCKAHERDGIALVKFLAWLDAQSITPDLTEIAVADALETFRKENDFFRGLSFPTISGAGPNGAIVHYSVSPETNRTLEPNSLYLVDSGAQYPDGTTDVTRTIAIGSPTDEMRDRFTRVLKGHIALSSCRFPEGTSGAQLDVLARRPLWEIGLDYDHGTGHGVGSYLSVHEGPQRISKIPNRIALEPGMILSNEPGYYKEGAYGIRLENLVTVVVAKGNNAKNMLAFEPLTLAPFDRRLIDSSLLNTQECQWVNDYHAKVFNVLAPQIDDITKAWLKEATQPL